MSISNDERERIIRDLIDHYGLLRGEAEAAAAIELGESDGDVVMVDNENAG